jgi:hypothetical protein
MNVNSPRADMEAFQRELKKGSIQKAYKVLLSYMLSLRTHFTKSHAQFAVSGLYQGYMDMTYFALFPPSLKEHGLKIAIVFNYDAFRFEAWLAAANRKIQKQYWELLKDSQWPRCRIVEPAKGIDSILECDLADGPDLDSPDTLTPRIETTALSFIKDIERFLSETPSPKGERQ